MINLQYEIKIYVKNLSKGTMKKLFTTHFYNFCNFPKLVFKIMKAIPSISSQIDEKIIFKVIDKHFSRLAPHYYKWINSWLIGAYENYADIDKYIILIYIINKDFIFFRRNGLIVDYDTFYKDKSLEIPKINISDIAKDLLIPKENVRRKISELEEKGIIKRKGKKIFIEISGFSQAKPNITLNDFSVLVSKFSEVLKDKKITDKSFDTEEISKSIKENFSFCWYQFYKFIFIFTNSWKAGTKTQDLETVCVGSVSYTHSDAADDLTRVDLGGRRIINKITNLYLTISQLIS